LRYVRSPEDGREPEKHDPGRCDLSNSMIFLTINVKMLEEDLDWSPSWREYVALKNTGDDVSRVMGP
jgi:hypothetical protein